MKVMTTGVEALIDLWLTRVLLLPLLITLVPLTRTAFSTLRGVEEE